MFFPGANDWDNVFRPAAIALVNGMDIYSVAGFFNASWSLFPLIPFALLPYDLGRALMFACAVAALGLIAWRFKASPVAAGALVLSPLAFGMLAWGNVEWLALLGLVMTPPLGIVLLLIKPQMTIAAILYLAFAAYARGGRYAVVRLATIPGIAVALSVAVYGFWFLRWTPYLGNQPIATSLSFFPASVPVGLVLFWLSLHTRDLRYAIAASPCFFPVLSVQSWLVVLLVLAPSTLAMILASIGTWLAVFHARGFHILP